MPLALPFTSDPPIYRVGTTLEGTVYLFDVRWNARDESWYFDLMDSDGDMILAGIKVALGIPLGSRVTDPRFPPGLFLAVDTADTGTEAGLIDLGERVLIHYYTAAEIA